MGPLLADGKAHELRDAAQDKALPPGALRIADLGYFSVQGLATLSGRRVYWLTRVKSMTRIWDEKGRDWELGMLLRSQEDFPVDKQVCLGVDLRLPGRLLAVRVPLQPRT